MSRRFLSSFFFLVLFGQLLDAKGSFGGGRGSSGARSSSSFSSSRGSSSSSSSSFSGSRSGSSSGTSSFRSGSAQYNSNFRQNVFHTTSTSTTFMYSPMMHSHVIISPVTPLYFGSYHYYWGGHYVSDYQRPQKCEYEISDEDEELRNVTFSNGTKPTTLTFGCKNNEECCGLECCSNSASTWVILIAIICALGLLFCFCSWCSKKGLCETETVVTSVPVIATTTTTTHSYSVPSAPPPPPGFQPFVQSKCTARLFRAPAVQSIRAQLAVRFTPLSSSQIHTTFKK
ncbi:unnamed protein product [Caenorhabditis sp. 36 PRJEB53466]|nr:unnamed protein product [Caenorhabditis sp. 36 PRJEB53466]